MFFRWWTFVEEVVAVGSDIVFKFNPDTQTPGPFSVRLAYQEEGSLIGVFGTFRNIKRKSKQSLYVENWLTVVRSIYLFNIPIVKFLQILSQPDDLA